MLSSNLLKKVYYGSPERLKTIKLRRLAIQVKKNSIFLNSLIVTFYKLTFCNFSNGFKLNIKFCVFKYPYWKKVGSKKNKRFLSFWELNFVTIKGSELSIFLNHGTLLILTNYTGQSFYHSFRVVHNWVLDHRMGWQPTYQVEWEAPHLWCKIGWHPTWVGDGAGWSVYECEIEWGESPLMW
jgi:hypothetical protein